MGRCICWCVVLLFLDLAVILMRSAHKLKQTKQNKTKQNKTKQNKTKQNKTKQNKTKQNKTKQNKTKQNKTKQNKTKQNKTKQNKQTKAKQTKAKQTKAKQTNEQTNKRTPHHTIFVTAGGHKVDLRQTCAMEVESALWRVGRQRRTERATPKHTAGTCDAGEQASPSSPTRGACDQGGIGGCDASGMVDARGGEQGESH